MDVLDWLRSLASATTLFDRVKSTATKSGAAALSSSTAATMELLRPTLPANLLGLPSACVSAGADEGTGLPIGTQVF
jgi:Asp-tRNA(Asn)/Glu-tRNA(Gln) amidotransferase A subunit family amidase